MAVNVKGFYYEQAREIGEQGIRVSDLVPDLLAQGGGCGE